MDKKQMLSSLQLLRSKLMATISMLLVSAILLTSVTHAWFVLSTAPEVTGVSTTSGANGALEIALQSTTMSNSGTTKLRLETITSDVGSSSALMQQTMAAANVTWGNIVDVSTGYGLEDITLFPARLNLGTNGTVDRLNYLAVPLYGTDGRIYDFKGTDKVSYADGSYSVDSSNYGVNVHGFPAEASKQQIVSRFQREIVRQEAVEQVFSMRELLRTDMINVIERNGCGIIGVMFATLSPIMRDMTAGEAAMLKDLILGLDEVAADAITALRWALLANVMADIEGYDPNNESDMEELGIIYRDFLQMELSSDTPEKMTLKTIASSKGYTELVEAISTLEAVQGLMLDARTYVLADKYGEAGLKIVSPANMYLMCGGSTPVACTTGFKNNLYADPMVTEDKLYFVGGQDNVVKGGILPAMASILGDYTATMSAHICFYEHGFYAYETEQIDSIPFTYETYSTSQDKVSKYSQDNQGVLMDVYDEANNVYASGVIPMVIERGDVTAYGYSIDLAFRASEDGDLALQQEGSLRVENPGQDPETINQNLQGSGSAVTFDILGDMTYDQVERLLNGLYVVFMNTDDGSIYGVGRVKPGDVETQGVRVTAPLTMYSVDRNAMSAEDADGSLILSTEPVKNNVITKLEKNKTKWVTAVVYLNGDVVNSSDVSYAEGVSLNGSINLQFALDGVQLTAMKYSDYYTAPTETQGS